MTTPRSFLHELAYPVSEMAIALSIIAFWFFARLAIAAGLLGLWLAVVVTPAFFRYLLYVLEARAAERQVPTLGGELFNWIENFWSLFPLVLVTAIVWGEFFLAQEYPAFVAVGFGLLVASIFPASMAILAITRSPVESLKPTAMVKLIRLCGMDYVLVLLTVAALSGILVFLAAPVLPRFAIELAFIYLVFLLFSFTGAVVAKSGARFMISIPDPLELTVDEIATQIDAKRSATLSHAYSFISRGNRAGGLAHIQSYIDNSPDPASDYAWFFNEMQNWESKDEALFFAQRYLGFLLDSNERVSAMKLITRCRLENSLFRPLPEDRQRALDVATQLGHDEMVRFLESPN